MQNKVVLDKYWDDLLLADTHLKKILKDVLQMEKKRSQMAPQKCRKDLRAPGMINNRKHY